MSENLPKPLPIQPERELYTSKAKQMRVMARRVNGESNRKIAREEAIDRETVNRILSQKEFVIMQAEQQSRLHRLGWKAIEVYEEALESDDLGLATATATKILEGTGVLNRRGLQGTIDESVNRSLLGKTPVLPEFQQGPNGFERPKENERTQRMPPDTALRAVPDKVGADNEEGGSASI